MTTTVKKITHLVCCRTCGQTWMAGHHEPVALRLEYVWNNGDHSLLNYYILPSAVTLPCAAKCIEEVRTISIDRTLPSLFGDALPLDAICAHASFAHYLRAIANDAEHRPGAAAETLNGPDHALIPPVDVPDPISTADQSKEAAPC
jgi:hypothetical protein